MCTSKEGKKLTRAQTKMLHAKYLAKGSKATLLHYKRIGFTCADIKFRMVNGEEDTTIHLVVTIFEHKIAKSWAIDDSFRSTLKAKCASDFYYYWAALLTNDDINNRKLPEEYGTDYTNNGLYTWVSVPQGQPDGGLPGIISRVTEPVEIRGQKRTLYEFEYDLSRLLPEEPVTIELEIIADFPKTVRAPFVTHMKTDLISVWLLFPADQPYRTYSLVNYPVDGSRPPTMMNNRYAIDHPYGSLIGWSVVNPEEDHVYECRWTTE